MSKKHYIAVAGIIQSCINNAVGDEFADGERCAAKQIASDFAKLAASDNPKFDTARFLAACGVKQ